MNKKKFLLASAIALSLTLASVVLLSKTDAFKLKAGVLPASLSCDYYFNPSNGYTSIYELNERAYTELPTAGGNNNNGCLDNGANFKTWGTVTCNYTEGSAVSQFIQSTDANGNTAGVCLYNINSSLQYPVGSVVTVVGKYTLYNGMAEMKDIVSIEKDYDSNPSPVETYTVGSSFFAKNGDDILDRRSMGTREVLIEDVALSSLQSDTQVTAKFSDNVYITVRFYNINTKTAINSKLSECISNSSVVSIKGYASIYWSKNNSNNTPTPQLLLRSPDDIIVNTVDHIEVTKLKNQYYYHPITNENLADYFIVKAIYTNGDEVDVTSSSSVSMSNNYANCGATVIATITYEYNDITFDAEVELTVQNAVYELEVYQPEEYYTQYDNYIEPYVFALDYEGYEHVTDECSFYGFDSSYYHDGYVDIYYVGQAGIEHTSSEYHICEVEYISISDPCTEYLVGDDFIMPTVYAKFVDIAGLVNITNRSSLYISYFTTENEGTYEIYFSYGGSNDSYEYTVSEVKIPDYLQVNDYQEVYQLNEEFVRPTSVYLYFTDYTYVEVADYVEYTGFSSSSVGTVTVTASYAEFTDTFTVSIVDKTVEYISVETYQNQQTFGGTFIRPSEVIAHFSNGQELNVASDVSYSGYNLNITGTQYVTASYTYSGVTTNAQFKILVKHDLSYRNYEYSNNSYNLNPGTSTYNFGANTNFEYYRVSKSSGDANFIICPDINTEVSVKGIPGYFQNIKEFNHVRYLNLVYRTDKSSGSLAPSISYGTNRHDENTVIIPYSTSNNFVSIDLRDENVSWVRVSSGDTKLRIIDYFMEYLPVDGSQNDFSFTTNYGSEYRIAPTTYSGTLVSGESYVDVPTSINIDETHLTYTVNTYKRYTYYSFDYIQSLDSNSAGYATAISQATMTDPVDVANYFTAFGVAPANYALITVDTADLGDEQFKNDYNREYFVKTYVFGSDTRAYSKYNRSSGYGNGITGINASTGYYEFDIDLDGSYYNGVSSRPTRNVGRVVGWLGGINNSNYGYGAQRVAHFTDDHYKSFQESNNFGGYMSKFTTFNSASDISVGVRWVNPITLTL